MGVGGGKRILKTCRETIFAIQLPRKYPHRGGYFLQSSNPCFIGFARLFHLQGIPCFFLLSLEFQGFGGENKNLVFFGSFPCFFCQRSKERKIRVEYRKKPSLAMETQLGWHSRKQFGRGSSRVKNCGESQFLPRGIEMSRGALRVYIASSTSPVSAYHDSQRRDGILHFFLRLEVRQFSPHFGAVSLLDCTVNLEKRGWRPEIADFCPLSWSNASWPCFIVFFEDSPAKFRGVGLQDLREHHSNTSVISCNFPGSNSRRLLTSAWPERRLPLLST